MGTIMQYVPILRFGTVEARLLHGVLQGMECFPLLEVTKMKTLKDHSGKFARAFKNEYMVDLPLYLVSTTTKHTEEIQEILASVQQKKHEQTPLLTPQAQFYHEYKKWIEIPVASSENIFGESYGQVFDTFQEIKKEFKKVAVRIFVFYQRLTEKQRNTLKVLFELLRKEDIVLLDVLDFEGVEQPVLSNVDEIVKLIPEGNEVYLLNAFDVKSFDRGEIHNYTPLLAGHLELQGFGDFATIPRFEPAGGRGGKKVIRYYVADNKHKLIHFVDDSFRQAFAQLENTKYWKNAKESSHLSKCPACSQVVTNLKEDQTSWKEFRITHHIASIVTDTLHRIQKKKNIEDFDPDGYDDLFKKSNNLLE